MISIRVDGYRVSIVQLAGQPSCSMVSVDFAVDAREGICDALVRERLAAATPAVLEALRQFGFKVEPEGTGTSLAYSSVPLVPSPA